MNQNDYNEFCKTLSGCVSAVGRAKLDKAAADIFFMKLSEYELSTVQWALVECTALCDNGYEYNVRLIKKTIERQLNLNKFRADAIVRLEQQEESAKNQALYLESDEYKKKQDAGAECLAACKEMLKDV